MRTCDKVAKRLIPCMFYGSFKMLKISASDRLTFSIHRRIICCGNEGMWSTVYLSLYLGRSQVQYGDAR